MAEVILAKGKLSRRLEVEREALCWKKFSLAGKIKMVNLCVEWKEEQESEDIRQGIVNWVKSLNFILRAVECQRKMLKQINNMTW